jgi:DNA-binding transcriptional MocR family regulator
VPGSRPYIAHCGSLSKILSPGLRIGWLVGPEALVDKAVMCKQFSDAHTSTFAQATAAHYLASGRMPGALASARRVYALRARAMADALVRDMGDAISFDEPSGGLFIWARLTGRNGGPSNASALARKAIERKVAFVPGAPFYARDPDLSRLRLSFATSDVDRIRTGVSRLAQAL